jgi:hypothetical protein
MQRWEAVRRLLQYCLNEKLLQEHILALSEHFNREATQQPRSLRTLVDRVLQVMTANKEYAFDDVFHFDPTALQVNACISPCLL